MKDEILQDLRKARDAMALKLAVTERCAPLGRIKRIELITGGMPGTLLCRIEPAVSKDGEAIAALFEGSCIGNNVYFSLTVDSDFKL